MHRPSTLIARLLLVATLMGFSWRDSGDSILPSTDIVLLPHRQTRLMPGPHGCTIVMAHRDGRVLVGNNEDRNYTETTINVIPASGKFFGRIMFGYADSPFQGGMNDQGLFLDANAIRSTGWKPDSGKPLFTWSLMMTILATCATCDDVKAFFQQYNIPALDLARFPVADRSGASMVVEYAHGQVQFVESDAWYQIATNFVISNITDDRYPCWRYRKADSMLSASKDLSVDLIRDVLQATHQEGKALTVYSNIYDLTEGTIYLYNLRNFREVVVLDFCEELAKGERRIDLPSLFTEGRERHQPGEERTTLGE